MSPLFYRRLERLIDLIERLLEALFDLRGSAIRPPRYLLTARPWRRLSFPLTCLIVEVFFYVSDGVLAQDIGLPAKTAGPAVRPAARRGLKPLFLFAEYFLGTFTHPFFHLFKIGFPCFFPLFSYMRIVLTLTLLVGVL